MTPRAAPRERPPEIAPAMVDWRGGGASGAYYGFYKERDSVWRADIIACRRGASRQGRREYTVFVEGEDIGVEPSLEKAKALVAAYFEAGCHHPQLRRAWPRRQEGEAYRHDWQ